MYLLGDTVDHSRSINLDTAEDWSREEAILGALAAPAAS